MVCAGSALAENRTIELVGAPFESSVVQQFVRFGAAGAIPADLAVMAHPTPSTRRPSVLALGVALVCVGSVALAACGSNAQPAARPIPSPAAATATTVSSAAATARVLATLSATGDPALDEVGKDLAVFEQEAAGLDEVIAAANPGATK